jgi:hypothetical protein
MGCWCCGGEYAEVSLIRLGAHPDVAVCLDCARFLSRRAATRHDEHHPSLQGIVRGRIEGVRGRVIGRGWHERGAFGAFLRRLDRFLP